jgi:hypothetical protein
MEPFEMTEKERIAFEKEVVKQLTYLKIIYDKIKDPIGNALSYLNKIQTPIETFMDNRILVRTEIGTRYPFVVHDVRPTLWYADLMWEYMCLIAFLKRSFDSLWVSYMLPAMVEMFKNQSVKEELHRGLDLVGKYIAERKRFQEALQAYSNPQTPTNDTTPVDSENTPAKTEPAKQDMDKLFTFNYRKSTSCSLLIDFLSEECRTASDADWARHALALWDNWRGFLKDRPAPFKVWLKQFCQLFGREWKRDYEPKKLRSTRIRSKVTSFLTLDKASAEGF